MEIWKDIELPGIDHPYQISNLGRVKALAKSVVYKTGFTYNYKEKIMTAWINTDGYYYVHFYSRKKSVSIYKSIHALVATAFVANPDNKPCVNHKDGNKINNSIENLEWCTHVENIRHAIITGLSKNIFGELNASSKLTEEQVIDIKANCDKSSVRQFAKKYNVNRKTISAIVYGKSWNSIRSFTRTTAA